MSGSPFHGYVRSDKHPRYYADRLIERLGGDPSAPLADILSLLQSKEAAELQGLTTMFEELFTYPIPFKPILDKDIVAEPFLPDEPLNLIQEGRYNKVPMIIGSNRDEGILIKAIYSHNPAKYDEDFDNWSTLGPLAFFHREKDEVSEQESKVCLDYVNNNFGSERFSHSGRGSELLVEMYTDAMFRAPAHLLW